MGRRSVLVLTGEPSGDAAGARLVAALREREPSLRARAVGGRRLAAAGAEIVQDIGALSAMGFAEILRQVPRLRALEARLRRLLVDERPDAVVPIDYPGFNLRVARFARACGVPVVYYIGPQVWAWGAGRLPGIARSVDRMLIVFPFERAIYERAGIPVEFVGHPLLDALEAVPSRDRAREELGLARDAPVLGLVPGSRPQEIRSILPVMVDATARVRRDVPSLEVLASTTPDVSAKEYDHVLERRSDVPVRRSDRPLTTIATASDALLVTSGTATLECALVGTPLAVLYRTSRVTWFLGKRLVKIPRIALANIVAGEEVVPEFLQDAARPEPIAAWATELLRDESRRRAMSTRLRKLRDALGEPGAAGRAADAVLRAMGAP